MTQFSFAVVLAALILAEQIRKLSKSIKKLALFITKN